MKILVINWQCIKNPFGGGAEVHFHEVFKRIAAAGNDVTLFCSMFNGALPEEIIDGIKIIRTGKRDTFNFTVYKTFRNPDSYKDYDVIIDDINKIPFFTPLFIKKPLVLLCHHFFGKAIFHEAGFIRGSYVYLAESLIGKIYRKTHVAVVSESTKQESIEKGLKPELMYIVPNAINQQEFPMKVGEKYDFPCIAYFGRMKKYKSVDHLVRAFAIVAKQFPTAQLHLLGRGDFLPYLESLSKELGIFEKCRFFGYVSDEDKIKLLGLSQIVVNTSIKEGWGITNIEANACGTPVVSADVPGLRDSVSVGKSGLLYEYGKIPQLASILIDLLTNDVKRTELSQGAVDWANSFSWDESAKAMLELLTAITKTNF